MENEKNKNTKMKKFASFALTALIVLSLGTISVTLGKYIVSQIVDDDANVGKWGSIRIVETDAVWDSKEQKYVFGTTTHEIRDKENINYFDITKLATATIYELPKDPTIILSGKWEVPCELYLGVFEIDWPEQLTYKVHTVTEQDEKGKYGHWKEFVSTDGDRFNPDMTIYKFDTNIRFITGEVKIPILLNSAIYVEDGDFQNITSDKFNLRFMIWVEQINF